MTTSAGGFSFASPLVILQDRLWVL